MSHIFLKTSYKKIIKPLLFQFEADLVHERMTGLGELLGSLNLSKLGAKKILYKEYPVLRQKISGINFETPIGLAAGFDYDAKLTQILPALGFGFETVGTITYNPYAGNPRPLLGRLPKSRSLLVNKGFMNKGAEVISRKLKRLNFDFPLGISIGRTNNPSLSQSQSVKDIVNAFIVFEEEKVKNSYYEINISCPNLFGNITFYTPQNLKNLLDAVKKINLKKPVFIKMPIEQENKVVLSLLALIAKYDFVKGVIFGNLQKNKKDPALFEDEVKKCKMGYFSGKPTWQRSNELIALAYKKYRKRFLIIGCGGVFSAEDAYWKIKLGASLVQLITGMVYEGPQLISEINEGLEKFVERDGFSNIKEAIGIGNN